MITDSFTSEHILTEFRPRMFVLVRLNEMLIFTGHETNCNKHRLMQSYTYLDFAIFNAMFSRELHGDIYGDKAICKNICGQLTHTRVEILDQWLQLWVVAYSAHSWHIINQNIMIYTRWWSFCLQRINRLQGYKPGTCDQKHTYMYIYISLYIYLYILFYYFIYIYIHIINQS